MSLYAIYGIAGVVVIALGWLSWKMFYRVGKQVGEAQQQAEDSSTARDVEQATSKTQIREMSDDELLDWIRKQGGA